ncbi:ShlB/FhaC/HecB family hemolysin secretion/activation protein, partial [Acidithiobacillus ferriphilus]|uniref:ShlB/FhaC/HecB family hemolysin secretion/activation protein n=1 Tax=Acidithiobacillus ferriphilus TaxID=1689834 RepID=UPI003AF1060B
MVTPLSGTAEVPLAASRRQIDLSLDRTQTLFNPWRNASVALEGTFGGQYSPDILPSSETFYLGGNHIAQGYYSGQVTGDDALYA